jgi:TPR repeat protein
LAIFHCLDSGSFQQIRACRGRPFFLNDGILRGEFSGVAAFETMNNPGRSQFPSIKLDQLVYVELEASNGGMMLTVSEDGFTFRAVTPVGPGRKIGFSFVVNGTEKLEGYGNIDWTQDAGKVANLQFADVTPEFRSKLRTWLTQLSAPAVPSFSNDRFVDPGFSEQRGVAHARASAVEPVADSVVEPVKAPSLSAFVSAASPLSSIAGLADQSANAVAIAPEPPAPRETFLISDWEYPRKPQTDSRPPIRGVAIAAIVIVVVALTILLYGYHDSVGQLLISLGQKMSAPKEVSAAPSSSASQATPAPQTTSAEQPLKVPDVPKPSVESPQPASTARENSPTSPEKGLGDQRRYRTENASASVKPQTALPAASPAPATSTSAAQIDDPAERVHSLWAAVAQGNTSAEVTLAKLYLIGGGVTKSCDQARVLLQAAAKKGNGEALDKLSQINQQGCP